MTRENILTRLHKLADIARNNPMLPYFQSAAHYVISDEIVQIMGRDDVQRSLVATVEAGVARPPYSPLLIEFSVTPKMRRFVLLEERDGGGMKANIAVLFADDGAEIRPETFNVKIDSASGAIIMDKGVIAHAQIIGFAIAMALLMLNTRGIEKQVIEAPKLNKLRNRLGKTSIPKHQVIRIGTIYDREGRAVSNGTGRTMPVHMRAGHARQQVCGPNRADRKLIYVPPVLVNYVEGADVRKPEKVVRL